MKKLLIAVLAGAVFTLSMPVVADMIPDLGKDMAKGQMDNPGSHRSDVMKQKRHYKTMKMKKNEMARKMAASGPVVETGKSGAP